MVGVVVAGLVACGDDGGVGTQASLLVTESGAAVLALAALEGGAPIVIGVALDRPPEATLVVEIAADPLVALDRTSLTFTATDFARPQPIVITAVDDAGVVDGAGAIVLTAPGLDPVTLPIAVADDDRATVVGLPADVLVMEGAATTFAIALASDPGGPVTLTLASDDEATAAVAPGTLTFAADWATPQIVSVAAPADADADDDEIALAVGGLHVAAAEVPVVVLDTDRQNLVITPTTLALAEAGGDRSFTVRLTQPPVDGLAIAVTSVNPAIAAVSPATLRFTAADYQTPQVVTVTPRVDLDGSADTSTVRLAAGGLRDRSVAITVAEDATVDLPAIDGSFLLTFLPAVSADTVIRYRVTYALDPVAATVGYSAIALRVDNGEPIGEPITASATIDDDGRFTAPFDGTLPAEANPFTGAAAIVDAVKLGRVVDADLLCGTMTGGAGGLPLDGTTWGAVRITGGTLPAPVLACP